ncbi:malonate decarboxylase holo-ACP synthase [Xylocopilactobacillus apicola]|uniref:Malonate decarboxylase holo-[acyl-carrier-protein] synthase n=1 Tax=Xylocopilactobacillus apicola TaxID=2932184 RepID=A0AAU9DRJ2_9LACO|nr:malonate decarboxylase holo-ACP synthase [Xylocopilactobacillus apicola]BDR58579.1 malonate decarboxylase holo-[acyl-carrier-protein] synthase [Xylocopilactobacillus apicola]
MGLPEPHTLVKIKDLTRFFDENLQIPEWSQDILQQTPFVIVRRGSNNSSLPVGIRGFKKSQRFAADLSFDNWEDPVTPRDTKDLISSVTEEQLQKPAFKTLHQISPLMIKYNWGVSGSLQFEVVTKIPMVNPNSDLDVIITADQVEFDQQTALDLIDRLNQFKTHVDVQIVHGQNGFSLEEYANQRAKTILVKTAQGPQLVENPWNFILNFK